MRFKYCNLVDIREKRFSMEFDRFRLPSSLRNVKHHANVIKIAIIIILLLLSVTSTEMFAYR